MHPGLQQLDKEVQDLTVELGAERKRAQEEQELAQAMIVQLQKEKDERLFDLQRVGRRFLKLVQFLQREHVIVSSSQFSLVCASYNPVCGVWSCTFLEMPCDFPCMEGEQTLRHTSSLCPTRLFDKLQNSQMLMAVITLRFYNSVFLNLGPSTILASFPSVLASGTT